jgi:hypothetical protein
MDAWKELFKRWPRLSIYGLILYFVFYSLYFAYETYRKNTYDAERPYIENLFSECLATSDVAARIATAVDYPANEIKEFWRKYYGKLVIFEDETVAVAMKSFGDGLSKKGKESFNPDTQDKNLLKLSLTLAGACRDLIKATWGLSMVPWKKLETGHEAVCPAPKCSG